MKIVICGSMYFYKYFEKIKKELEDLGHEVIIPLPDENYSKDQNVKRKAMEDFNNNLKKSEAILVANYDKGEKISHIGINSLMEIGMAFNLNKKVFLLNNIPESCKDELEAIGTIVLNGNLNLIK